MNDIELREFIVKKYETSTIQEIADMLGYSKSKMLRTFVKFGIPRRGRSEAQKLSLLLGKGQHPTKGKEHSTETRRRISSGVQKNWDKMSERELKRRGRISKELFAKRKDKEDMWNKAGDAVRETRNKGSKLEVFLYEELTKGGYFVEFHKSHVLVNEELELDMFIPKLNTAIEIDGPSHFEPIWGEEVFYNTQRADKQKNGLITGKGMVLIRIKNVKKCSEYIKRETKKKLFTILKQIEVAYPEPGSRLFFIEV